MNELYTFYKDVLGKLDFSITSYPLVEERINEFFSGLCESPVFIGRDHIDFISYDFAKLKNPFEFEIETLTGKRIFFNSFNERSLEMLLMHDYYNFKDFLAKLTSNSKKYYSAEIVAKLFVNGTSFRVLCNDKNHTSVKYEQHLDTISIQIPYPFIFKRGRNLDFRKVQNQLFSLFEDKIHDVDLSTLSIIKKENIYNTNGQASNTELISKSLLNTKNIEKLIKTLYGKLEILNKTNSNWFFGDTASKKDELDEFVRLIVSHGFSSFLFNCWIENIPSVVNVEAQSGDRRSLGALVVGYRENNQLTYDERTYFKLISDRISHILAADTVYEFHTDFRYRARRREQVETLKKFKTEVLEKNGIHHGGKPICDLSIKDKTTFFEEIDGKTLEERGLTGFKDFVESLFKDNAFIHKGFFVQTTNISNRNLKNRHLLYSRLEDGTTVCIKFNPSDPDHAMINVVFPHLLINEILTNRDKDTGLEYSKSLVTRGGPDGSHSLEIVVDFQNKIDFTKLINSITGTGRTSGSLGLFLREQYEAIRILGNLKIFSVQSSDRSIGEELLCFETDFIPSYENRQVVSLKMKRETKSIEVDALCYRIEYRSI